MEASKKVDSTKLYSVDEAISLVKETSVTKFDSTVEVAIKLNIDAKKSDQNLRGSFVLPNGISHIKFLRCFQKNQKNFNQLLSRYQNVMGEKQLDMEHELSTEKIEDASVEQKEEEIFKAPMSPVITSFQEICASLEKLPDSVQKRELVEQTKDLLNRYQNAIGDISSLEQESERQSQRIKIESAFNNRLVLLRQDILNEDQQLRDDIDSIQQLQTLNEQLTAMLLSIRMLLVKKLVHLKYFARVLVNIINF